MSGLKKLAKTTADDWDEIPSFLLSKQHLERIKRNQSANTVVPPKLHFKQFRRDIPLQKDNGATCDPAHLDDIALDRLIPTLQVLASTDPIFKAISSEERITAQFDDAFCVDIRRRLNEGWQYRSVITKTELYGVR